MHLGGGGAGGCDGCGVYAPLHDEAYERQPLGLEVPRCPTVCIFVAGPRCHDGLQAHSVGHGATDGGPGLRRQRYEPIWDEHLTGTAAMSLLRLFVVGHSTHQW
jgi:hypothetical protein